MQVKAGKYAHLSIVDDVEETKRKLPQDGSPQIAIDPLIERRIASRVTPGSPGLDR